MQRHRRVCLWLLALAIMPNSLIAEDQMASPSRCQQRGGTIITASDPQGKAYRYCLFEDNSYCLEQRLNYRKCRPGTLRVQTPASHPSVNSAVATPNSKPVSPKYCVQPPTEENGRLELIPCQ